MNSRFLISVAVAALIAGTGFASAQAPGGAAGGAREEAPPAASSGSQSVAPTEAPKAPKPDGKVESGNGKSQVQAPADAKASVAREREENKKALIESEQRTTDQLSPSGGDKLTPEHRAKLTEVIKKEHLAPETNITFSISVGTRVPPEVRSRPLPEEIVADYPDWRGFQFFLVSTNIIVVNPRTFEIVAIVQA